MISEEQVLESFPDALVNSANIDYFRGLLERKLLIKRCDKCGYWVYPAHRTNCASCWSEELTLTEVAGKGTVFLYSLLHQGPPIPGVDYSKPHPVVAIELEEQPGLRYLGTMVGCEPEDIQLDMPVELVWTERGGVPCAAFTPAGKGAQQ